jgi:hypothetical protein
MRQPDRSNPKQPAPPGYCQKPRNTPKSEFWLKIAKKAEFCYFLGMATTPNKKGTKNMDINKIKTELERELLKLDTTKSVSWENVGSLTKGYNFVSKEESEKWLTRNHTRLATPQEVAEEYGV